VEAKTKPIQKRLLMSKKKHEWFNTMTRAFGMRMTRRHCFHRVLMEIKCPKKPMTLYDAYADHNNSKGFFDDEPELVVERLAKECLRFWTGFPNQLNKKAEVGELAKITIYDGFARHGKENLRKTTKPKARKPRIAKPR